MKQYFLWVRSWDVRREFGVEPLLLQARRCWFRGLGHPIWILLGTFQSRFSHKSSRTHWRDHISHLALGTPQGTMLGRGTTSGTTLLGLMPPRPNLGYAEETGWMDGNSVLDLRRLSMIHFHGSPIKKTELFTNVKVQTQAT